MDNDPPSRAEDNEAALAQRTRNQEAHNDNPPHDPMATQASSQLFTVRIWPEIIEQGNVTWRGKVQQVPNGAWRYFHEWQTLTTFLQTQIMELATDRPRPPAHASAASLDG